MGTGPVAVVTLCHFAFTALAAELPFLQTRLRASESTVEQLRRKNTGYLHLNHTLLVSDIISVLTRPETGLPAELLIWETV